MALRIIKSWGSTWGSTSRQAQAGPGVLSTLRVPALGLPPCAAHDRCWVEELGPRDVELLRLRVKAR